MPVRPAVLNDAPHEDQREHAHAPIKSERRRLIIRRRNAHRFELARLLAGTLAGGCLHCREHATIVFEKEAPVYNIRAERSAGWSGLAFLAIVIVASVL